MLLGELDKFVHVSAARFGSVVASLGRSIAFDVSGAVGERVKITILEPAAATDWVVRVVPVVIPAAGIVRVTV